MYGIVEVPLPKLRENDVLIKVKACGVCGTDLHIHEGEFIAKVREASYIESCRSMVLSTFRLAVLGPFDTWMVTINRLNPHYSVLHIGTRANISS